MALRVLLVHQTFPSQLISVLEALEHRDDVELAAIGMNPYAREGLRYRRYSPALIATTGDIVVDDLAAKATVAAGAAAAARALSYDGFVPDIIVAHPGWGEALYLKDLFPQAKLVCYCEYYYLRQGGEVNFDPEFPPASLEILHRMRARNAITLASLEDAEVCVAPTLWQRFTFPELVRPKIQIIHEGIVVPPPLDQRGLVPAPGRDPHTVTYIARHLEPHRGFHIFMRTLPALLARNPQAEILVVGAEQGGYGAPPEDGRTWKAVMLDELDGTFDAARVQFLGTLDRQGYLDVLNRSTVHTYLTYPFVLSWSALEAMGAGCAMVVSDTAPTREVLIHGDEVMPVNFFDTEALAEAVSRLLSDSTKRSQMGKRAQQAILDRNLTREHGRNGWRDLILSL
ncbi:glycosyltransferase [Methylobacterium sp. E-016]|uniref:glycosyltransferase n=1 Tax=Methylobacterium sp. E-016 TaxID=2836556 RepID=UPI001FBB13C1|nr:glycosyltransferase [Methylobacterium sp. E-016]MCJ2074451.1 glycosyltransferase [Methylobacterium sp. E-016]